MKPKVKILTENQDVGLTLLLWLADYFGACEQDVVITDKNEAGELVSDEFEDDEICVKEHYDGSLKIVCSPSLLTFQEHSTHEAIRNAQAVLGQRVDDVSLEHLQVVQRQQKVRDHMRESLEVEEGDKICRFLLRVDGFPHTEIDSAEFLEFHEMLYTYRVPYLLGVRPNFKRKKNNRLMWREIKMLHKCIRRGASVALQAPAAEQPSMFESQLKQWEDELRKNDIWTLGFISESDRYDAKMLPVLKQYYELFCGGPDSTSTLGYRPPSFFKGALYIPSYRDVYDIQPGGIEKLDQLIEISDGVTIPITVKWGGDRKLRLGLLQDICLRLSDRTFAWDEYLYEARLLKQMAGAC